HLHDADDEPREAQRLLHPELHSHTGGSMKLANRGQTLALFSLTCLLIALMVLVTLSLGAKVRDRMDLQTVADAAAYSNAIATARTLNSIAVMNRVQVAHTA